MSETNNHRFIVRGALAKGTIQHGRKISSEVSPDMAPRSGYKQHLLFGIPMIQAFNAEKQAPPFGIYIHESARTVDGLQGCYYYWRRDDTLSDNEKLHESLRKELISFLKWEKERSYYLELEKTSLRNMRVGQ